MLTSLFLITMESWLVCPANMELGLKLLLTEGGKPTVTRIFAVDGSGLVMFVPPPVELNALAGMVFARFMVLLTVAVTLTDTVHEPRVEPT